jgi:DNA-binding Lrp family transcriptional regulator
MLIPDEALEALVDAGLVVTAEVQDDGRVDVVVGIPGESGARTLTLEVRRYSQPVTPQGVAAAANRWGEAPRPADARGRRGLLLVTPTATADTVRRAAELGVSLIALDSDSKDGARGHLALGPGDVRPLGRPRTDPAPGPRRTGVPAWGESQIVKALLLLGGRTQTELAHGASVSQPRVSQVLKRLAEKGLVRSATTASSAAAEGSHRPEPPRRTWDVVDWDRLLRHWIEIYPGPGGVTTYWYGLDPPSQQARAALGVLGEASAGRDAGVLVSGDVAADVIAPWARPVRATLYAAIGADLSPAGLTPCPAADATLALIVPEDAGVWIMARLWWQAVGRDAAHEGLTLADPLQVLHDVRVSPSVDTDQVTETLTARIRTMRPDLEPVEQSDPSEAR